MQTSVNGSVEHIKITNSLCVPQLTTNLLSVSQLVRNGNKVTFDETGCSIKEKKNELVAIVELHENMFRLKIQHRKFQQCMQTSASSANIWHRRLGRLNENGLSKMRNGTVDGIEIQGKIDKKFNFITCCEGKLAKQPFNMIKFWSKPIKGNNNFI